MSNPFKELFSSVSVDPDITPTGSEIIKGLPISWIRIGGEKKDVVLETYRKRNAYRAERFGIHEPFLFVSQALQQGVGPQQENRDHELS